MPKAIITVGISCSGKTTWAEEWCRTNNAVYGTASKSLLLFLWEILGKSFDTCSRR